MSDSQLAGTSADIYVGAEEGCAGWLEGSECCARGGGADKLGVDLEQGTEVQIQSRVFEGIGEGTARGKHDMTYEFMDRL